MNSPVHLLAAYEFAELLGQDWRFAEPQWLALAWASPALGIAMVYVSSRITRNESLIADDAMIDSLIGHRRRWNTWIKAVASMLAVVAISIAAAQPQTDPHEVEVVAKGRDVVFLVDVSRSMLARDVSPSRLEKSKLWINDLVDELGNDRVGLVAFSGSSAVLSPLTTDRLFFKLALEELSPKSVLVGGTNIGDAIRKTMDMVFVDNEIETNNNFRDLVLITDGEDQESLPIEAARLAGARGVRVIAIGIGSDRGANVPMKPDSNGSQTVVSKLESGTLRAIAAASPGGVYLEVGTGTIDLAQVYRDLISNADQREIETTTQIQYAERFMFFVAAALLFIVFDMLIPAGTRRALT